MSRKRMKAGRVSQLLLRYFAEVIIIFLGITISFLFEQWREEKRQEKELVELAHSLLSDIDALKMKLNEDLSGSTRWIRELDSLRIQRSSGLLSEKQLAWFYSMTTGQIIFLFDPYSPTYMSAAESGLLNELPDSIRNKLYGLYRVELPLFQLLYVQQQENITNFRTNTMVPTGPYLYLPDAESIQPDLKKFAEEMKRPVYGNFINQTILIEKEVYSMNEAIAEILKELEKDLQQYIKNQ